MKTTLITKLVTNVTDFSPAQIEAYKAFMLASFSDTFTISFEVLHENEADQVASLLERVRAEFKEHDEEPQ
jgi:hypothetical protein